MQDLNLRDALQDSIDDIDSVLGKGYAKANSELIAATLKAKNDQEIADGVCVRDTDSE